MLRKLLFIETLGCAMNVRDSEHIIAELTEKDDYDITDDPAKADLLIINTCSVREKPVHKLFSEIGHYNTLKKTGAKLGICGCTASHLGSDIIKKAPSVNFVLGARNVSKIKTVIQNDKSVEIDIDYDDSSYLFGSYRQDAARALVNISIGCDKECTYCIVPHTRGSEISIPVHIIVDEVRRVAANGIKEVILLGQNVNNYGKNLSPKMNFTALLREVSRIDGIERIRFTSPHPLHADDEFLEEFAANPKICKNMHLPLQSGSTKILRQMKRGYTKEWFLGRAEKIRALCSEATISTDVIVGFPGEDETDFLDTLDVVKQVGFEFMFSFAYSARPLTKAADMPGQIEDEVKKARLSLLQDMQLHIQENAHKAQIGSTQSVLIENITPEYAFGKTSAGFGVKVIDVPHHITVGSLTPITITDAKRQTLIARIV